MVVNPYDADSRIRRYERIHQKDSPGLETPASQELGKRLRTLIHLLEQRATIHWEAAERSMRFSPTMSTRLFRCSGKIARADASTHRARFRAQ